MILRNILLTALLFFTGCKNEQSANNVATTKVAIFLPTTHQALEDITKGFKEEFTLNYPKDAEVIIFNAMGNQLLLKTQIEQALQKDFDLFVPVGTQVTQMTLSICPHEKILYLAANNKLLSSSNIHGVQDEIPMKSHIELLQSLTIKKLTLLYSASDKIFPEVEQFQALADQAGIQVQKLFIQKSRDLFSVAPLIESDSEALFILKDHLVVSGVEALVQIQNERNIPLIASDEGSVKRGAALALAVREEEIGKVGALLAIKLLNKQPCEKEITIENPTLFSSTSSRQEKL